MARVAVWFVALVAACGIGWRDSYRSITQVWQHPEAAMCGGLPSFQSLATTLPPHGDVIFVGAEPRAAPDGDFFQFFRRFFCIQYALAPLVVHFTYTPALLSHELAGTVTTFVIDTTREHEETRRSLHALASRRGQSLTEIPMGTDFATATIASR